MRAVDGRRLLGEGRAVVPDGGPLDRRRADHRHSGDGQDRRPAAHLRGRRHAGRHRCPAACRRVGVHQSFGRPRHLDRHRPRRGPALDAPRHATRRPKGHGTEVARAHDRARRAIVRRHARRSTATVSPRSKRSSTAGRTRPTIRVGRSGKLLPPRSCKAPICFAASSKSPRCSTRVPVCSHAQGSPNEQLRWPTRHRCPARTAPNSSRSSAPENDNHEEHHSRRSVVRSPGRRRGSSGPAAARLSRFTCVVAQPGAGIARSRIPRDRARPARLRRLGQAGRRRQLRDPQHRRRRGRHPRLARCGPCPCRRARLGCSLGVGDRGVHSRSRRSPRRIVGRASVGVRLGWLRTASEVVVLPVLPVRGHRRAVAVGRRLRQHARVGPPSRHGSDGDRPGPPRSAHRSAQLVPRERAPAHVARAGVGLPASWRRRRWACGAAATSRSTSAA